METVTAHIVVQGRVQGVGFRWYIKEEADDLGLSGMVENRADGDVEVNATGPKEVIEKLIEMIEKGNGLSIIEKMTVKWKEGGTPSGEFNIVKSHLW